MKYTNQSVIQPASASAISTAVEMLGEGKLVAFPTETVYGLGADATNDSAVAAIYEAKGRPQFNPLIIHVADINALDTIVEWNDKAEFLASIFWPGPLTFVLPRKASSTISLLASAGLDTLAVRCPNHPIALELLRSVAIPIAAPSANSSGKLSPTTAVHVYDSLGTKVELIIDGGPAKVGVESTVLDLTSDTPTILRHGGVTQEDLAALLGTVRCALTDTDAPKSPGMLKSHYAPSIPIRLNVTAASMDEAFLTFGDDSKSIGGATRLNLSSSGNDVEAAANLFNMLRLLDRPIFSGIAVMPVPDKGLGAAINDRLRRAAMPVS